MSAETKATLSDRATALIDTECVSRGEWIPLLEESVEDRRKLVAVLRECYESIDYTAKGMGVVKGPSCLGNNPLEVAAALLRELGELK